MVGEKIWKEATCRNKTTM